MSATNSTTASPRRAGLVAAGAIGLAVALGGCSSGNAASTGARLSSVAGSDVPLIQLPALPTPTPTPTPSSPPPAAPVAAPNVVPAAPDLLVNRLVGVGNAQQVISVTASGYGTSYATLQAFSKSAAGWTQTFGPWTARIGQQGFAPPGQKREGDLRTPTGAYGFTFFFGVNADPGVKYPYRLVDSTQIVWDDDPASPNYNLWMPTSAGAGASPEPMYNVPVYDYGAVIAYNTSARTPGLGSAIFLHQNGSDSTAGCVSLPQSQLLAVLRWLDPAAAPVIVMGTTAAVTQ